MRYIFHLDFDAPNILSDKDGSCSKSPGPMTFSLNTEMPLLVNCLWQAYLVVVKHHLIHASILQVLIFSDPFMLNRQEVHESYS